MTRQIDGEGTAWAAGGLVASILIGILIEPFRRTVGLENVVMIYLATVVLIAAAGGRAAGLLTAVSAALSYDFFLTTPYHSLVIDSPAQVITVGLLLATGLIAGLAGRARRRLALAIDVQADLIALLNAVARAAASGGDIDQVAAEGIRELLDARRVAVQRTGPDGAHVVADAGDPDAPLDSGDLPHLDDEGRTLARQRPVIGTGIVRWRLAERGIVFSLVRRQRPVGSLVVILNHPYRIARLTRLALATVAQTLAAAGPAAVQRSAAP